jgi:uncharacterized protein YndB with AHSA1/START domain
MTTSTPANQRIVGSVRSEHGKGVVRMEDVYETDAEDLWSALTEPERLARWIGDVRGDLHVGGTFHAALTSSWEGPGRVDTCERPTRLTLTMDPGQPDETVIDAHLSVEGGHTRLVIEERGLPLAHVSGHGAGWQAHVEDLVAHLAGHERGDWHARWTELIPGYRALAERLD